MTNTNQLLRPDPIRLGRDNAFANHTMAVRVPGIIRDVQQMNPNYPASIQRQLDQLHADLTGDQPITMPDLPPLPGYAGWEAAFQAQRQTISPLTWQNVEWFFAETLIYRKIIEAVRWFETGRDPYTLKKQEELHSDRFWRLLDLALDVEGDFEHRLKVLIAFALWGNRVDLSHPAGELSAETTDENDLLVDDRDQAITYLTGGDHTGPVHIVVDNAGSEIAMDLVLADLLAGSGIPVILHVKGHPTFVSDTTLADIWQTLDAMETRGGKPQALAQRLRAAWNENRLKIAPHVYWNSSQFLWDMPPALVRTFEAARLVILKGDVNYRRAIGDALWDVETPFQRVVSYFPAPLLALRSLKSDAVTGLTHERINHLNHLDPGWRVGGQYGLMQFARL